MSQQNDKGKPQGVRIHAQLAAIMAAVDAVGKDRKNSGQGFLYRGIEDVMDALHPIFAENKVFVLSEVLDERTEERATMKGGNLIYRVLKVKVSYVSGEDGSRESVLVIGEGMDSGDKAANKAMSAALKYALTQTLILPYGQMDSDEGTPPESRPKTATTATAAADKTDGADPQQGLLIERMASDGVSNAEMVDYCKRKEFLPPAAGPADLMTLPAALLRKMLAPENWKQVLGVIEARRPKASVKETPPAATAHKTAPTSAANDDRTAFHARLYDAMALCGLTSDDLNADLRRKGIMTAAQTIDNLPEKIVNVLLDGTDKASGRGNWEIVVDRIKKARVA